MGYTTYFFGEFRFNKPLSVEHSAYLARFAEVRHMQRSPAHLAVTADPLRVAADLPIGEEGAYFVGSRALFGQDYDHPSIVDENEPPKGQPGLWCQWVPTRKGAALAWNGGEKFYEYGRWLEYLIAHFLKPWGYALEGTVRWLGEDPSDHGTIYVAENEVFLLPDKQIEALLAAE